MKQLVTTLNEYKEVYNTRLEIYLIQYVDYSEKDFIDKEIIYFDNCLQTSKIEIREKTRYIGPDMELENYFEYDTDGTFSVNTEVLSYLKQEGNSEIFDYFDLNLCEKFQLSFKKIIEFLQDKKKELTTQTTQKTQKFYGSQIEFIELIKSLIENGNLKGTQKDIIENCKNFFDIEINNPEKTISDINKRNNGSETLFIDKLKNSLFNYIQQKSK